jgi:hypothetical protein
MSMNDVTGLVGAYSGFMSALRDVQQNPSDPDAQRALQEAAVGLGANLTNILTNYPPVSAAANAFGVTGNIASLIGDVKAYNDAITLGDTQAQTLAYFGIWADATGAIAGTAALLDLAIIPVPGVGEVAVGPFTGLATEFSILSAAASGLRIAYGLGYDITNYWSDMDQGFITHTIQDNLFWSSFITSPNAAIGPTAENDIIGPHVDIGIPIVGDAYLNDLNSFPQDFIGSISLGDQNSNSAIPLAFLHPTDAIPFSLTSGNYINSEFDALTPDSVIPFPTFIPTSNGYSVSDSDGFLSDNSLDTYTPADTPSNAFSYQTNQDSTNFSTPSNIASTTTSTVTSTDGTSYNNTGVLETASTTVITTNYVAGEIVDASTVDQETPVSPVLNTPVVSDTSYDDADYDDSEVGDFDDDDSEVDYAPVILDVAKLSNLTDTGVAITQLSSSNTFFDLTGSGQKNLTAWAGVGNGILFFDPTGTGQRVGRISRRRNPPPLGDGMADYASLIRPTARHYYCDRLLTRVPILVTFQRMAIMRNLTLAVSHGNILP